MPNPQGKTVQLGCAVAILLLGLAVRWPRMHDSLWFDEMTTFGDFVQQPWSKVLAAGAGDYVPNNHVLHTILVKLIYPAGDAGGPPPREAILRIPALVAGLLVPLALAWPLRRDHPWMALALAVLATLNPWLVVESTEARGYTLMLLLGILSTNALPSGKSRWPIAYVMLLALAIYTVPLAVLLIPAHLMVMLFRTRRAILIWLLGTIVSLLFTSVLYQPMLAGLQSYYKHPYKATMDYRQFLDALPRYAFAGMRLPVHTDPLWLGHESMASAVYWALPVVVIVIGSVLGWRRPAVRPLLITLGLGTLIGILLPLVTNGTTEPRFVQWILPWYCLAAICLLGSARGRWAIGAAGLGFVAVLAWQLTMDLRMPPNQQIREGLALADRIVPADRDILVIYIGASESLLVYGDQITRHDALPAFDRSEMSVMLQHAVNQTGHLPWIVVYYEKLAFDRDRPDDEAAGLWRAVMANYHLATQRLPGRISPVAVYAPNKELP
jgi:uncharacterized membrane protein